MADGRSALHMTAERSNAEMVRILMDRSLENENADQEKLMKRRRALLRRLTPKVSEKTDANAENKDDDSELDGELVGSDQSEATSFVTGSFADVKNDISEDNVSDDYNSDSANKPDFYKSNVAAWDYLITSMRIAITEGHKEVVTRAQQPSPHPPSFASPGYTHQPWETFEARTEQHIMDALNSCIDQSIVEFLVQQGINVNAVSRGGLRSPYHSWALESSFTVLDLLRENLEYLQEYYPAANLAPTRGPEL
ncbi:hypothetical protein Cpir12675_005799 [Ceratocystis pirilliformis]|uniref:Ankyrin repeat protein n=1 Tax=Ceratocystis pirilliformis TaxID=259994 RepID=A0ABR3YPT6_9PEZI